MFKKKRLVPVALSALFVGATLTGCTSLLSTNSEKDMAQTVATVDISLSEDFSDGGVYEKYADAIKEMTVSKRDLVAAFINNGSSYVSDEGYTYEETFDLLLTNLVNRKIVVQYAMVYCFENVDGITVEGYNEAIASSDRPEIAALSYFLPEEEYNIAVYNLRSIINSSLDSTEEGFIYSTDSPEYTSDVRTTPTGVDTEVEDYYDADYRIYTGINSAGACGSYETQDGSTPTTRKKAYNSFLSNLADNNLLSSDEDTTDFETIDYWYEELEGQLESALITYLGDKIEEASEETLTQEFVTERYNEIFATQKQEYDLSQSDYETDIDALSDSQFVLYSPVSGYGFVYNILLPFSETQLYSLTALSNDEGIEDSEYYEKRAALAKEITATDQRGSWMTGETDYSFKASENEISSYGGDYLFFENNVVKTDRYEAIPKYYGHYAYKGTVEYDEEEEDYNGYTLTPDKITVDDFIGELEGYAGYAGLVCAGNYVSTYATNAADFLDEDGEIDYSKFIYYTGKINVDYDPNTMFVEDTNAYTAVSVINELMFAYSTDTGCFNKYLGYSVSIYDTSYVKEFEYAAKKAVEGGVGTYTVCLTDYGWHLMYCSTVFSEGEVYSFNWDDIETEGTFSYYFYEALKDSTSGNKTSVYESQLINKYGSDDCVTTYPERYADYSALDSTSSS